jgi:hypothetical protein
MELEKVHPFQESVPIERSSTRERDKSRNPDPRAECNGVKSNDARRQGGGIPTQQFLSPEANTLDPHALHHRSRGKLPGNWRSPPRRAKEGWICRKLQAGR